MTSARISRQCSKCKDAVGSFNCAGCKEIFCLKHSIEHRQELSNRFEQLMTEHNITLQQMQDKEPQRELLKKNFYSQIDEWKNAMIERVCQRAEEVRHQLDVLMDIKNEMMIKDIRSLTNEIHQRHEKEDFFENDIKRIQKNIKEAQQAIEKSIQQSEIELGIESNETVDWKNLIYIQEKSNSANSSVTNKDKNGTRNIMNSNREQDFPKPVPPYFVPPYGTPSPPFVLAPRATNSSYISTIRPSSEQNGTANFLPNTYPPPHQTPSNTYHSSNLPEKRQKKPLGIVDPVSHKVIEVGTLFNFVNFDQYSSQAAPVNSTPRPLSSDSSSATASSQIQTDFRQQFARLLNDNPNT